MQNFDDKEIKELLVRENYVSDADIEEAEANTEESNESVVDYLLEKDLITKDLLGQAIAESYNVPYADLDSNMPTQEQALTIPNDIAEKYRVIFFAERENNQLTVTTDNPDAEGLQKILKEIFPKKKISIAYSLPEEIDEVLLFYQAPLETRFSEIIENEGRVAPEILDEIFSDAFSYEASDIHFEPNQNEVVVRFRIDGVLQEAGRIPKKHYENILNRIKVMSGLRIDEHFAAQDGSMRYQENGDEKDAKKSKKTENKNTPKKKGGIHFDMRTSIVPTVEGEKVVLRILASYIKGLSLSELGLSNEDQQIFKSAAQKPFGMILVTGPTGSGKTTSLYALLKILSSPRVNVTTIEDPVEYKMEGVNQIQVNKETNLTFVKGLRSIVRQDPNIILVGEIRDEETAEIAINAALTGHLMLSTFHANDAATAIPRLLDMGTEPFLLASTLELLVAQRLVRKICEDCRYSTEMSQSEIKGQAEGAETYFSGKKVTVYKGKGCETCGHTGYKGRTAIFELIQITPEMKELILQGPSSSEVATLAYKQGTRSLFEDGVEKIKNGITTLEELKRVAEPPEKKRKHKTSK